MRPTDYHRRYRFIKPLKISDEEQFHPGDEITFVGERMFFNGGFVMPAFYKMLLEIVNRYETNPNFPYLRRVPIPHNKC